MEDGEYKVSLNGHTITLPRESMHSTIPQDKTKFGTDTLRVEVYEDDKTFHLVKVDENGKETSETLVGTTDGSKSARFELLMKFGHAFDNAEATLEGGRRRSRVNRKTRRSKGKRRNTKRTKFRNLASRRR